MCFNKIDWKKIILDFGILYRKWMLITMFISVFMSISNFMLNQVVHEKISPTHDKWYHSLGRFLSHKQPYRLTPHFHHRNSRKSLLYCSLFLT